MSIVIPFRRGPMQEFLGAYTTGLGKVGAQAADYAFRDSQMDRQLAAQGTRQMMSALTDIALRQMIIDAQKKSQTSRQEFISGRDQDLAALAVGMSSWSALESAAQKADVSPAEYMNMLRADQARSQIDPAVERVQKLGRAEGDVQLETDRLSIPITVDRARQLGGVDLDLGTQRARRAEELVAEFHPGQEERARITGKRETREAVDRAVQLGRAQEQVAEESFPGQMRRGRILQDTEEAVARRAAVEDQQLAGLVQRASQGDPQAQADLMQYKQLQSQLADASIGPGFQQRLQAPEEMDSFRRSLLPPSQRRAYDLIDEALGQLALPDVAQKLTVDEMDNARRELQGRKRALLSQARPPDTSLTGKIAQHVGRDPQSGVLFHSNDVKPITEQTPTMMQRIAGSLDFSSPQAFANGLTSWLSHTDPETGRTTTYTIGKDSITPKITEPTETMQQMAAAQIPAIARMTPAEIHEHVVDTMKASQSTGSLDGLGAKGLSYDEALTQVLDGFKKSDEVRQEQLFKLQKKRQAARDLQVYNAMETQAMALRQQLGRRISADDPRFQTVLLPYYRARVERSLQAHNQGRKLGDPEGQIPMSALFQDMQRLMAAEWTIDPPKQPPPVPTGAQ